MNPKRGYGKEKVGSLRKITLSWEVGSTPDSMDLTYGPATFDFIYNLAPAGLTPFEYELANKKEGDAILIHVERDQITEMFGHLEYLSLSLPKETDSFYLRLKVIKIEPAEEKEIIKAIANTASCSDQCCGN